MRLFIFKICKSILFRETQKYTSSKHQSPFITTILLLIATFILAGCDDDKNNIPPTIIATVAPEAKKNGWHSIDPTVTFKCTDGTWKVATCSDPVFLETEGSGQVITGEATDVVGNTSSVSVTINLDKTPPEIIAIVDSEPNTNGWHSKDPTITFECTDGTSGVATCSDPVLLETEGSGQVITGTATDVAGNTASVSVTINLDKTAPEVVVTRPDENETLFYPEANMAGTVDDKLAGPTNVSCEGNGTSTTALIDDTVTDSPPIFTCNVPLDPGESIITVEATDAAGNIDTTLHTVNYTPLPKVTITSPQDGDVVVGSPTTVTGATDGETVTVNDVPATINNGIYTASIPIQNGGNTIIAIAQNSAGSSSTTLDIIGVVGLNPSISILSPKEGFLEGRRDDGNYPLVVKGQVVDNRVRVDDNMTIDVDFGGTLVSATVVPANFNNRLCQLERRCWSYTATKIYNKKSPGVNETVTVIAKTGPAQSTRTVKGIIDFCTRNQGNDGDYDVVACAASLYQRPGYLTQSRRCIVPSNGCSNPIKRIANDPVGGTLGRTGDTRFGKPETEVSHPSSIFGIPRSKDETSRLPCNRHDECYHQWGPREFSAASLVKEKQQCNQRFLNDLLAVCHREYPEATCPTDRLKLRQCPQWRLEKSNCFSQATVYYDAVFYDTLRFHRSKPYDNQPFQGRITSVEECPVVDW